MAGTWVRSGTIALTSGSKKVTGTGTAWNSGLNKVTKGCALKHNNIDYEVDYVNSDTELYLVDTYSGATLSGQAYRIQVAVTDTIPELSSRIAQALAYWNGQGANLQLMMSGSGNVTLTFPDGTQVTIPAWGNMQPKDALLTAIANLTTSADKLFYATGADAVAMTTLSAKGRELIDDADASAMLTTLGVSTFIKNLLDDADAATALGTLGITKASVAETNSRLATDRVVTPAGLNAVVPYTPSVNPTLDLDFAKQKYRWYAGAAGLTESSTPSLMTFTRSTIAKFFDAMGVVKTAAVDTPRIDYDPLTGECKGLLIEESRTNLLTYSNRFDSSIWAKTNVTVKPNSLVAPDGSLTASRIITDSTNNYHRINCGTNSFSSGVTYTKSYFAKYDGYRYLVLNGNAAFGAAAAFDLTTGAVAATLFGSASISNAGNGWYRCSITGTANTTQSSQVFAGVNITPTDSACLGDGVTGVYLWESQLEAGQFPTSSVSSVETWTARASTATYLDSNGVLQTVASGVARSAAYDYDSDGVLRPIGLLLESAATNLLLYSEQMDNATWIKSSSSVTANAVISPDGNTTADKILDAIGLYAHFMYQNYAFATSTAYTLSCYVKAAEKSWIRLGIQDGTTTFSAYFDVQNGVIGSNVSLGCVARIKKAVNGFYRCELTCTTNASAGAGSSQILIANGDGVSSYAGDGSSGVYIWGVQLAAGNYATSYIATTSAQVTRAADTSTSAQATRSADNAVISGANFSQWFKQHEGSISVESNNQTTSTLDSAGFSRGLAVFNDNTDTNRIRVGNDAGVTLAIRKSGVDQSSQTVGSVTAGKHKTALSFITNNINAAIDTVSATPDTSAAIPYLTQLNIGKGAVVGGLWSGHIRRLTYFPKALAAAELQAMTA